MADRVLARKVLETEAAAILALVPRLDERFDRAVDLLQQCRGRVILTGMGKSGIICQKIAATLASTGTPAFFLHPAEALHGDLGVIQGDDVVVALSNSGETAETVRLLETIRRLGAKLIAITGVPASTLAEAADVALDCGVNEEACPLNLVPTASTTAALALGDALAMTLLAAKGFKAQDYANLHPLGTLGRRLMRVESVMHSGELCPIVRTDTAMRDVFYEMSRKGLGMTCVVDGEYALLGIITDGDLRRQMERAVAILEMTAGSVMTRDPIAIAPETLAAEALHIMEQRKITSVVVVRGEARHVAGVVHLHDLVVYGAGLDQRSEVRGQRLGFSGLGLGLRNRKSLSVDIRAKAIKLVLFDVDGVLTDGRVQIHADGSESKTFGIRDGIAMVWAQRAGIKIGFLSARFSPTTPHRAAQLGITLVYHGVASKLATYEQILKDLELTDRDVAYMGDDVVDLAVLARAGLAAAPADAVTEVQSRVHWISQSPAGGGAARELIEVVLRAQNLWDGVVAAYLNEPSVTTAAGQ